MADSDSWKKPQETVDHPGGSTFFQTNQNHPSTFVPSFHHELPSIRPDLNRDAPVQMPAPQSSDSQQTTNFVNFLQQFNFSVPPPPLPISAMSTQVPSSSHNLFQPNYAHPAMSLYSGTSSNYVFSEKPESIFKIFPTNESFQLEEILSNKMRKHSPPQVEIRSISLQIKNYYLSLQKLKNDFKSFQAMYSELDDESWNFWVATLSSQKKAILKHEQAINVDPSFIGLLKHKIRKRQKKREAKRRRKQPKLKSFSKYEVARSHMLQLQQIADKQKQEEILKEEADSTLYTVRHKKGEALGQVQFLTALSKLHAARVHMLRFQNKNPPEETIIGFNKIIDKLKSMWEHQIKEYSMEENGLKVMLKGQAETAENEDCKTLKKTFNQWLKLMFGTTDLEKNAYFSTYNELVEIRDGWDKYVVDDETSSSKIPAGWVVPKYRSSNVWSKFNL